MAIACIPPERWDAGSAAAYAKELAGRITNPEVKAWMSQVYADPKERDRKADELAKRAHIEHCWLNHTE
jgi:hypothetical protein